MVALIKLFLLNSYMLVCNRILCSGASMGGLQEQFCCMPRHSRFRIFKAAPTNYVLIADQQPGFWKLNLNILSLPGAGIRHAYDCISLARRTFRYHHSFSWGNDLFNRLEPSSNSHQKQPHT